MTAPTLALEDVARLVAALTERPTTDSGALVYTLTEVADMTKMSLRALEKDCRAGVVEHVHRGQLRGMTREQISKLLLRYSEGGDLVRRSVAADDFEAAREATRRSGARRGRAA